MISRRSPLAAGALARSGAALALGVALVLSGGLAAHADVVCEDDGCDGGLWQAARGISNEISYWGMGSGHDCTNYVAWKLGTNGVARPATNPGNAADWAANATTDGYLVDHVPAVGAVAQWGSFEGGMPYEGHVAYVERVNADGTLLISEDSWHADGSGPLRFRTLAAAEVPRFIHYGDMAGWMRQVLAAPGTWSQRATGLAVDASLMSAVSMGGKNPQIVYREGDELRIAHADASGWHEASTGITSQARSLTALNMGGGWPVIMSLEGTKLMMTTRDARAWSTMYTGIEISGEMSAVNAGGLWPTVLVSQGGYLYTVTNDGNGWLVAATGVEASGPLSAVSTGGSFIDVYTVDAGILYRVWFDGTWWHRDSTGLSADGALSATSSDGSSQVIVGDAGTLAMVNRDAAGWHRTSTGVDAGATVSAVDMGGLYPVVFQNR